MCEQPRAVACRGGRHLVGVALPQLQQWQLISPGRPDQQRQVGFDGRGTIHLGPGQLCQQGGSPMPFQPGFQRLIRRQQVAQQQREAGATRRTPQHVADDACPFRPGVEASGPLAQRHDEPPWRRRVPPLSRRRVPSRAGVPPPRAGASCPVRSLRAGAESVIGWSCDMSFPPCRTLEVAPLVRQPKLTVAKKNVTAPSIPYTNPRDIAPASGADWCHRFTRKSLPHVGREHR